MEINSRVENDIGNYVRRTKAREEHEREFMQNNIFRLPAIESELDSKSKMVRALSKYESKEQNFRPGGGRIHGSISHRNLPY